MVAYSFNAQQHTPQYGGASGLPVGPNGENMKYKVMLVNSFPEDTKDQFGNVKGGYLAFEMASIEGPTQGVKQIDRINLHHTNPKVVEIANKQLSAYCHVLGKFQFNDTAELHNIPFIVEIGLQKEPNPNRYTEVKAIYDINGNEPGKAGAGPQVNQGSQQQPPNGPPAGGVQPQGSWGGQAPQGQGGFPADNGQQHQPQGGQQGWGGPQGGPADQGQQQQPQGGGWGGQQQPQGQPQGQGGWGGQQPQGGQAGGGWGQQGGGNASPPGWGQR